MADLDLVMTAAAPTEAPPIDAVGKFAILERPLLTMPFNVTGSPAMSVCCGYTDTGLPLSFQIVGKRFDDATVLRVAHAYEQATPWRDSRPALICKPKGFVRAEEAVFAANRCFAAAGHRQVVVASLTSRCRLLVQGSRVACRNTRFYDDVA